MVEWRGSGLGAKGLCDHSNESSLSTQGGELLDYISVLILFYPQTSKLQV
jgi:hypothetical protein